jgi:glycosyltransferase involved in cell wall biosynthesis
MNALPTVLCFSHVRWSYGRERTHQLMLRCAKHHRVFFIEEPVIDATYAEVTKLAPNLWRVVPHLAAGYREEELHALWRGQLTLLRAEHRIDRPILWYSTPAAVPVSFGLPRSLTIYDCGHNLTEQHETAIPGLLAWERELVRQSDLVLVTSRPLLEAKSKEHALVHEVPNSIDLDFFAQARGATAVPSDQASVPGPRIGYAGRIDDRLDFGLLARLAELRPKWNFVLIGDLDAAPDALPSLDNIHYLGGKSYDELPGYLADWDAAMLPLSGQQQGRATIPRLVLQYLAAGKPVVGSALPDLSTPFGDLGLVRLAEDAEGFAAQLESALGGDPLCGPERRDAFLAQTSWDGTWARIHRLMLETLLEKQQRPSSMCEPPPPVQPRSN